MFVSNRQLEGACGRKRNNTFVQETWLVNTPTLILSSEDRDLQPHAHQLVTEKRNKSPMMISSM